MATSKHAVDVSPLVFQSLSPEQRKGPITVKIIHDMLEKIGEILGQHDTLALSPVMIPGVGKFWYKTMRPRRGFNPVSRAHIEIGSTVKLKFKPEDRFRTQGA